MNQDDIPFNKVKITSSEPSKLLEACRLGALSGDGGFTRLCHKWLEENTGCNKALLTHSCTAALEMSALLLNIEPGDEIIMPSYTFVSTANAFALRGGVPVFVDIREDTLNIDEGLIEGAITDRTKAIVPVHYAGVSCEMDAIMNIAKRNNLFVIEDAAQGVMSAYKGRALGSIGDLGVFSFHETKNIVSGEGGALLVNNQSFVQSAEIIREKGTNRSLFQRGEVDKYTWQQLGSSYLPGELIAAFLHAQFEHAIKITKQRLSVWQRYHAKLDDLENNGFLRRPVVPDACQHNAHMYYVLLSSSTERNHVLQALQENGVMSTFHYVPLHSSPAGQRYCRSHGDLQKTNQQSERIIRLPIWADLSLNQQDKVIDILSAAVKKYCQ